MAGMRANRGHTYRERIGPAGAGKTLSAYLAERYRHTSEADWRARIREGRVSIDGEAVEPGTRLAAGQELAWDRPGWVEPAAPLSFAVLHEDADVLAVAKPAGLPTLPGADFLEHTLLHQLERYAPGLHPLHRLGRHTSGIVLCARSVRARSALSRAWRTGAVVKIYRALAAGTPASDAFEITTPIGPVPYPPLGSLHAASDEGKPARSIVRVLRRCDDTFLCDVEIPTGRPHQIRIHLAAAGHPLAGDPLYVAGGLPRAGGHSLPGHGGYSLHAMQLTFPHPNGRGPITVRCPPPVSLRTAPDSPRAPRPRDLPSG